MDNLSMFGTFQAALAQIGRARSGGGEGGKAKVFQVRMDMETWNQINLLAKGKKITGSELCREIVYTGLGAVFVSTQIENDAE